jgi:hypothetical protein
MRSETYTMRLFTAEALTKAGTVSSVVIDLRDVTKTNEFSLQSDIAGLGTVLIEYLLSSTKDGTFSTPEDAIDIATAQPAGTNRFYDFDPELSPWMKIKVTENNVGTITSLDLWINMQ